MHDLSGFLSSTVRKINEVRNHFQRARSSHRPRSKLGYLSKTMTKSPIPIFQFLNVSKELFEHFRFYTFPFLMNKHRSPHTRFHSSFKFSQSRPFPNNMKDQMDEKFQALSSILHGCELAKQLENNLPALASQPRSLLSSCEEITRAFNRAMNLLNRHHPSAQSMERGGHTQGMGVFYPVGRNPFDAGRLPERSMNATEPFSLATVGELGADMLLSNAGEAEASGRSRPIGERQASDTSDSGGSSMGGAAAQRSRRR